MTKFQKIGLIVVAFCATVAITRRIQQEYDKDAVLRSANETQALIACPWRIDIVASFERHVTMLHW
jgi:hypothetical protein